MEKNHRVYDGELICLVDHATAPRLSGILTILCRTPHNYLYQKTDSVSNFPGVAELPREPAGTVTMQLDLDLIFPILDVASAKLMTLKAACLWNAGVIDARQRRLVEQRAQQFLATNIPQGASAGCTLFCAARQRGLGGASGDPRGQTQRSRGQKSTGQ
jgi:hypothetical protein